MNQSMKVRCGGCHKTLLRVRRTAGTKGGRPLYVYESRSGKRWINSRCPDCSVTAKPKTIPGETEEDNFIKDPVTTRKCRECLKPLPASLYFRCSGCKGVSANSDSRNFDVWTEYDWGCGLALGVRL